MLRFLRPSPDPIHQENHWILSFKSGTIRTADDICYLDDYHPWHGGNNSAFNDISRRLLDLKKSVPTAIKHYEERLAGVIYTNVAILVMPSSDPTNVHTGIRKLAKALLQRGHWIDQSYNLFRTKKIEKYATGGKRDYQTQLDSLALRAPHALEGRLALILDDVTTSGTSFRAARQQVLDAGASRVYCLAMGKTV